MAKFVWFDGEVSNSIRVSQVYGIIFTLDGRLLLKVECKGNKNIYSFAGGTPEIFDKDKEDTLRRELIEEVNVTIKNPIMLGYQEVDEENGTDKYAQVRMIAIIDSVGEIKPDPDNGETYMRLLTTPDRAIELLNWGEVAKLQINAAVKVAKEQYGINKFLDREEYI